MKKKTDVTKDSGDIKLKRLCPMSITGIANETLTFSREPNVPEQLLQEKPKSSWLRAVLLHLNSKASSALDGALLRALAAPTRLSIETAAKTARRHLISAVLSSIYYNKEFNSVVTVTSSHF